MKRTSWLSSAIFFGSALGGACSSGTSSPRDPGAGGSLGVGGSAAGAGGTVTGGLGREGSGGVAGTTGAATGAGGAATGAGGAAIGALWRCPAGPFTSLPNTTALAAPQALAGAPLADNYAPGGSVISGPAWLGGALYVSQIVQPGPQAPPPSRILKIIPGGATTVFAFDDGTNGLAILPDGDLVGAIHLDGSVCRVPLANPNGLIPIAFGYAGGTNGAYQRFNAPSDLAVRGDGNIYFSDPVYQAPSVRPQAQTRVYRISPLPAAVVTVVDATLDQPNGVTLSLDENTLYVSGPGLYKYPILTDGSVGARQDAVSNPTTYRGGAGMVIDCAGDLYVALAGSVAVINPAGLEVGRINVVNQAVTNVAFGGADYRTLFITTSGANPGIFTVPMPLPGMPY